MHRVLAIFVALILIATSGFAQVRKLPVGGTSGGTLGGTSPPDTIRILQWPFTYGMPVNVTEVGDVAVVDGVLVVTFSVGTSDYIRRTTSDAGEYSYGYTVKISSGYTGWDNDERLDMLKVGASGSALIFQIIDDNGTKHWRIYYTDDIATPSTELTIGLSDDTWYDIYIRRKKSSAVGADDGELKVYVDGDSVFAAVGIDDDARDFSGLDVGATAGPSGGEIQLLYDNIRVWTPEGLP